jgi:uncharacterized protein YdhG (YjbR/CyaY superfamily)
MDKQVNEYIEKQQSPHKEILKNVKRIFQETLPSCEEKMAWGAVTFAGGKFYIAAMKNRVHVGFAVTGLSEDERSLFEGSGKTMRHIKIPTLESIDKKRLVKLIELVNKKATCKPC